MLTTTPAVGALPLVLCGEEASRGAICGVRLVRLAFFDVQALSELHWRRHHGSFASQVWRPTDLAAGRRIYIDRQLLEEWKVLVDERGGASASWVKKLLALAGETDERETRLGPAMALVIVKRMGRAPRAPARG